MGTGEGKSIVIAMLAVFMAKLHGLKVLWLYLLWLRLLCRLHVAKLHGLKVIEG